MKNVDQNKKKVKKRKKRGKTKMRKFFFTSMCKMTLSGDSKSTVLGLFCFRHITQIDPNISESQT